MAALRTRFTGLLSSSSAGGEPEAQVLGLANWVPPEATAASILTIHQEFGIAKTTVQSAWQVLLATLAC